GKWWLGSSYAWDFEHPHPTEIFRKKAESLLQNWLKIPFTILDHKASIRPATIERRPFVGFHPLFPQIGILNGLGTKGCSLAPYFARQMVDFLLFEKPIQADANISRFAGILSRSVE
ncbi:MAG: FAD-dependent oxidoreductase, partial [Chitinophagaceae bacterium]|nr:FAD-dependent oxidoreductase [Chitinophagaceae bacterium]